MENRAHAAVAIGFLIVLTVVAGLVYRALTAEPDEPRTYRIVTRQSVAGLAPQSRVEFKGIEVGHVRRIRFDPRDHSRVVVDFSVRRDAYVTHATYAVLAMQGLTGGKVLELKLGAGSAAPLPTSAARPARVPLRKGLLAELESAAQQDMQALHQVLASANAVLDARNRAHIGAALQQLDTVTARLATLESQLEPTLAKLPALLESTRQSIEESHQLLAQATELAGQAQTPLRKAGQLEDSLGNLSRQLNRQTAPDVEALSASLTRTSRLLQELLQELQTKPQSLIFGPPQPPPGPGEPGFDAHAHGDHHD